MATGLLVSLNFTCVENLGDNFRNHIIWKGILVATNAPLGGSAPALDFTPTPSLTRTATRMPIRTPTARPSDTPTPVPTPPPTPTPIIMIPTPIPVSGFRIDSLEVTYRGPYPAMASVRVTNLGTMRRSAMLVLRWEGFAVEGGEIGRRHINLDSRETTEVEFDLHGLPLHATVLIAEVDGETRQTFLQSPPLPSSYEYTFELFPYVENATELRVTNPDGYSYVFPVKRVRITVEAPEIPGGFSWERVDRFFYAQVPLQECLIQAFMPWWIAIFTQGPAKVVGTEIICEIMDEALGTQGPIGVGTIVSAAEAAKCWRDGILYPFGGKDDEVYLIIGREAHLVVEYTAGTHTNRYVWKGRGEWKGVVTDTTSVIVIPITFSQNQVFEIPKSGTMQAAGEIAQGETASYVLSVEGKNSLEIYLSYPGSDLDLHLYDPQGRHVGMNYDTGSTDLQIPGAEYSGNHAVPEWIRVGRPDSGDWRALIYGVEVSTESEPYEMEVKREAASTPLIYVGAITVACLTIVGLVLASGVALVLIQKKVH